MKLKREEGNKSDIEGNAYIKNKLKFLKYRALQEFIKVYNLISKFLDS